MQCEACGQNEAINECLSCKANVCELDEATCDVCHEKACLSCVDKCETCDNQYCRCSYAAGCSECGKKMCKVCTQNKYGQCDECCHR